MPRHTEQRKKPSSNSCLTSVSRTNGHSRFPGEFARQVTFPVHEGEDEGEEVQRRALVHERDGLVQLVHESDGGEVQLTF